MDAVRQLYRIIVYRALVADMHGMYYMSFYRASEVHGMYIHLDRAFISRCARGTCYYFVYRALIVNMHGIYCHVIVYRHARHLF